MVRDGETGFLQEHPATAATGALSLDRDARRRFAENRGWARSTAQFVGNLSPEIRSARALADSGSAADS